MRAIGVSRLDEAIEFLLELVKQGRPHDADDALQALELLKGTEELVKRLELVVAERGDVRVSQVFQERFVRKE